MKKYNSDNMPKSRTLPHYGVNNISKTIKEAGRLRGMSSIRFILRKSINYWLAMAAYFSPLNSSRVLFHRWRGVRIGSDVFIGMYCIIDNAYPEYIVLDDKVMLAGGNHLLAHSRAPEHYKGKLLSYVAPVHIGQYCWLGINSIVLPGTILGEGVVVSAGSVVTGKFSGHVVIQGNPAEIIRSFDLTDEE